MVRMNNSFEFSAREILGVLSIALLLNLLGIFAVVKLKTFFFLDMIGTALIAVSLGPWWAASVGLITNSIAAMIWHDVWLDYAPVNIIGGLFWGYVGRALWPVFRSGFREIHLLTRMLLLGITGGIIASLVAVPIRLQFESVISEAVLQRSSTGHVVSELAEWLVVHSGSWLNLVVADALTSIPDKTLSFSFAVLVAYHLFPRLRGELENPKTDRRYRLYVAPGSLLVFIALYLPVWLVVIFRGPVARMESALWTAPLVSAVLCLLFFAKSNANGLLPTAVEQRRIRAAASLPPPLADLWASYTIVNALFVTVYAALIGLMIESGGPRSAPITAVGWAPFLLGSALYALGGIIAMRDLARRN